MNQNKEIQEAVLAALDVDGQTQRKLAKQIGVSEATIDNVKKARWENVSDTMAAKFRAYFRLQNGWGIRSTFNFAAIKELITDAMTNHRFLAAAGFTGSGKTTAAKWMSNARSNVYYVLANALDTRKTLLSKIQQAMGIDEGSSINAKMASIIRRMQGTTDPVLIIDDGGKLNDSCLRLLQIIYDETEFHAGIVLLGTEHLKKMIDRKAARDTMGFRELKRRIAYWQPLRRPTLAVVQSICKDYAITDNQAVRYIHQRATDYGTLRNIIENAVRVASASDSIITREILSDLHVGESAWEAARA